MECEQKRETGVTAEEKGGDDIVSTEEDAGKTGGGSRERRWRDRADLSRGNVG